jgi:hypothetical protein
MHAKVHGKTSELDEDLGVVDGQEVEVQARPIGPKKRLPDPPPGWRPGGTETAAGMMAENSTDEDDRILMGLLNAATALLYDLTTMTRGEYAVEALDQRARHLTRSWLPPARRRSSSSTAHSPTTWPRQTSQRSSNSMGWRM